MLTTSVDYPDPGSFLSRMLGKDVPTERLPTAPRRAVERLDHMTGDARDRAAVAFADRLASGDVPVVAFGTSSLSRGGRSPRRLPHLERSRPRTRSCGSLSPHVLGSTGAAMGR